MPNMEEHVVTDRNYHQANGVWLPRVTAICGMYPKGYGFSKWLGDAPSMEEAEAKRDEAAERGTRVHAIVARLIAGERVDITTDDLDVWRKVIAFGNFWEDHEIEVVAAERFLSSDSLKTAGTCDLIAKVDGKLMVVDWKAGNGLYPSYWLQVAAYAMMYEEETGQKVEELGLVRLGSKHKRGYEYKSEGDPKLVNRFVQLFRSCHELWDAEHPHGPRLESLPLSIKL